MKTHGSGVVLFQGNIPFRLVAVSDVRLIPGATLINPGETKTVLTLTNRGDTPVFVDFRVDGIPTSYIDPTTPPNSSLNAIQSFLLMPGDSRALILRTVRAFWESPQYFPYTATVRNAGTGQTLATLMGSVTITEFYDLEMSGTHLNFAGTDKDKEATPSLTGSVVVTNWGNVPQDFHIFMSYLGWYVAGSQWVTPDVFTLAPGALQVVEVGLTSTGVPFSSTFSIEARSQYNSTWIEGSVTIVDDDTDTPQVENISLAGAVALNSITDEVSLVVRVKVTDSNGIWCLDAGIIDASGNEPTLYLSAYFPAPVDGWYEVTVPSPAYQHLLGTYDLRVVVWDADRDNPWDPLSDQAFTLEDITFTVVDDDITPPAIISVTAAPISWADLVEHGPPSEPAPVPDTSEYVVILVNATDQSGISSVVVQYDGQDFTAGSTSAGLYCTIVPNPGLMGIYPVSVVVTDADTDRPGDTLTMQSGASFTVMNLRPGVRSYITSTGIAGNYPGTYTFSDRDVISFVTSWMVQVRGAGGQPAPGVTRDYVDIMPEHAGHKDVLRLSKNASGRQ